MAGIIGIHGDHSCEGQGGKRGLHLTFPEVAFERVEGRFDGGWFGAGFLSARTGKEAAEPPVQGFLERGQGV